MTENFYNSPLNPHVFRTSIDTHAWSSLFLTLSSTRAVIRVSVELSILQVMTRAHSDRFLFLIYYFSSKVYLA